MKLNKVSVPIIFVLVVSLIAIWKLNESYRQDFMVQKNRLIEQQSSSLVSSVSGYLSQLKNILTSYENGIVESQINWQQIKPFFILARAEIKDKKISVQELYAHSDSIGRTWNSPFLTQALSFFSFPDHDVATKLFKNKSGQKFMAVVFGERDGRSDNSPFRALVLVAEADVFQKFFNISQSQNITYSLLTADQIVAAHSQSTYIATVSQERKNKNSASLFLIEPVRGTDLTLISYSLSKAEQKFLVMPLSVLGIIIGACFVLVGVLAYAYIPLENLLREQRQRHREEQYSKTLQESKKSLGIAGDPPPPTEEDIPPMPTETDGSLDDFEEGAVLKDQTVTRTNTRDASTVKTRVTEPTAIIERTKTTTQASVSSTPVTQTGIHLGENASIGSAGFYEVTDLIESALKRMHTVFRENKINLLKNIESTAKVDVDPDRFVKAICNVLINSVEAIKGRERKEIEIHFFEKQSQLFLTIKDSGPGIREEDKEKIWQPFFTTKSKKSHKGLGLSEAISIARRYGFELSVKTHPTGGAIAEFSSQIESQKENSMPALPVLTELDVSGASAEISDIEIDNILNLEDIEIKELQPTHFKLENVEAEEKPETKIEIVEDPEINISFKEKNVDMTPIQIRKPSKDRAGSD